MTLGEIIKQYRLDHKMSMDALAEKSGVSKSYISLLEKNKHPHTGKPIEPSIQIIKQFAKVMNIDFNELFSKLYVDINISTNEKNLQLYKNIRKYRTSFNMSQETLAKLTGYADKSSIAKIEKGIVDLQISKIELFAKALQTPVKELMGWEDENNTYIDSSLTKKSNSKTTAQRIRKGMELRGLNQSDIVKRTGISKGALSSYLAGRYTPKQNNIYLIAKALNVNEAWLMGADVPMSRINTNNESTSYKIPVLGRVAAGIPLEAIEDIIDYEEIPEELAKTGEFFGLKIKGDSMEPRIREGDVVIVRKQDDAETGDVVVAMINGDDATCKRLKKYGEGIMLISNNPAYEPFIFNYDEIREKPVRIVGKVIELRGKL